MPNYWLLSAGKDGELWPAFWTHKLVAVGWSALGDLRKYHDYSALVKAVRKHWPEHKRYASQVWNFYQDIQPGELIFVRAYGALIGFGEVQGDYEFIASSNRLRRGLHSEFFGEDFAHIRRVRWLSVWGGLRQPLTLTRLKLMA